VTAAVSIALQWLPHGAGLPVPKVQTALSAGADLHAAVAEGEPIVLAPGARALVPCGFAMALPAGYEAQVRPRSGLAAKHGVTVLNSPGTIDADYRGEVKVILVNLGQEAFSITRGERVAQMVVAPVVQPDFAVVEVLDETTRGTGGFGSTGR
jgi:dUTP pyrophosphatase